MGLRRNLKLIVAYDGTGYAGFQRQAQGIPTVQAALESAIYKITREEVGIIAAGRTDSGVHARGQVVNFTSQTRLREDRFLSALNAVLPEDIAVQSVETVPLDFHARFSAVSKTYGYYLYNQAIRPVFNRNWGYFYHYPLEIDKMIEASLCLIGTHDFKCFQATGSSAKTTVRTINHCEIERRGSEIQIIINGNGFLYHMVRNIVGTLILVGSMRMTVDRFQAIVNSAERSLAGPTAPARGLCLEEVFY